MTIGIRGRILLITLTVAAIAVLVTAWVTNRITFDNLRDPIEADRETSELIYDVLSFYALTHDSWDEVNEFVISLSEDTDERIALTTADGTKLADSADLRFDETLELPASPSSFIDPLNPAVGYEPPDEYFHALDTQQMWEYEFAGCLDRNDVEYVFVFDEQYGYEYVEFEFEEEAVDRCFDEVDAIGLFDELEEFPNLFGNTEPALLFLGEPATAGSALLGNGLDGRLLVAVAGILAAGIFITFIGTRRLLRPVVDLTEASIAMEGGDLGSRVSAEGKNELGDLGRAFNRMATAMESEDVRRRALTSDIAHELRTPLSNIRGYLEAALDGVTPLDESLVESVLEDAGLLQRIIEDLQMLAMSDSGELRVMMGRVELETLVAHTVDAQQAAARAASVELDPSLHPVAVRGDEDRIRQVLLNLIGNAIRHTGRGGVVRVLLRPSGEWAELVVSDNGEGIAEDDLPHIFERFYRADSSRARATGGSGLGLSVCKELVERQGGTIEAASERGVGTTITVRLPRHGG